jgi:MFS-type transporter involved in bile tolerance (Atg22 family)
MRFLYLFLRFIYSHSHFIHSVPTQMRGAAFGLCNVCARVGGILAPVLIAAFDLPVVLVLFGTAGLIGGSLVLLLRETLGRAPT